MSKIKPVTGIYKITSPIGRIYIGRSYNIRKRMITHKSSKCKYGDLKKSFILYGFNSHKIEIIHELPNDVDKTTLDAYESLYIQQYKECGALLFNKNDGGLKRKPFGSSRAAYSIAHTGRPKSQEHKRKVGEANKIAQKGIIAGEKNPKAKLTLEQVLEIRSAHVPLMKYGNKILAEKYGVSISTIERVTSKGKDSSWKHI